MLYILFFTCVSTPLYISFHKPNRKNGIDAWNLANLIVDICFGIDIFVVFFSAFYDDDFQIVDNLKDIARNYIFGWFFLDLIAITPFDEFTSKRETKENTNVNAMVRMAKLGRIRKTEK